MKYIAYLKKIYDNIFRNLKLDPLKEINFQLKNLYSTAM